MSKLLCPSDSLHVRQENKMKNPFGCLGVIYTTLSAPTMLSFLLQKPKHDWASLEPYREQIHVYIPNIETHIGCIPFPLNAVLIDHLDSRTSFGILGGLKEPFSSSSSISIETILNFTTNPVPTFNLAMSLFICESITHSKCKRFIKINVYEHARF